MDTKQLKMFVSLSQTLNFSETARSAFVTQPAVSHQLKILEEEVNATLIYRSGHTVEMTEEGKIFLEYAHDILNLENRAKTLLGNMRDGKGSVVKIAALPTLTRELSQCLSLLADKYPKIQVIVDQMEGDVFQKEFVTGDYDFYFGVNKMFSGTVGYKHVVTSNTDLRLYVNKEKDMDIDPNDWDTIRNKSFVSVNPTDPVLPMQIRTLCKHHGFEPNIVNYYNRAELVPLSVNAGVGIAILPKAIEYSYPYPNIITYAIDHEDAKIAHIIAWKTLKNSATIKLEKIITELYQ